LFCVLLSVRPGPVVKWRSAAHRDQPGTWRAAVGGLGQQMLASAATSQIDLAIDRRHSRPSSGEDLLADRGERPLEGGRELATSDPPGDRRVEGEVGELLEVVGPPTGEFDDLRNDLGVEPRRCLPTSSRSSVGHCRNVITRYSPGVS
jgi:hypothetical protein